MFASGKRDQIGTFEAGNIRTEAQSTKVTNFRDDQVTEDAADVPLMSIFDHLSEAGTTVRYTRAPSGPLHRYISSIVRKRITFYPRGQDRPSNR